MNKNSILFLTDESVASPIRCHNLVPALKKLGIDAEAKFINKSEPADYRRYHNIVLQRPVYPIGRAIGEGLLEGCRIIVDMDDDFRSIPKTHPAYSIIGPGAPIQVKVMEETLKVAHLIVTSTAEVARRHMDLNSRFFVIPNGLDLSNPLWSMPNRHDTINIGFTGTITHREDFLLAKKAIEKVLKWFKNAKVVIGGDDYVYWQFAMVPERQKAFIPGVSYDLYPYTLSYFDILVVPLKNDHFNQAKSDIKLIEAGARRIPYVASPLPQYLEWSNKLPFAGLIAHDENQWEAELSSLVESEEARKNMGGAGYELAKKRDVIEIAKYWERVVQVDEFEQLPLESIPVRPGEAQGHTASQDVVSIINSKSPRWEAIP